MDTSPETGRTPHPEQPAEGPDTNPPAEEGDARTPHPEEPAEG